MLNIGVLGAGHLGKIHIKCLQEIPGYELVGFFDAMKPSQKKLNRNIRSGVGLPWRS